MMMVIASLAVTAGAYPVKRPVRINPVQGEGHYVVYPERTNQVIKGIGFEIQSDSIKSGNKGLPEERTSVPHDLTAVERVRFCNEMLKGFRYCRLAGGLYWRGLDAPEQKVLVPRWPEQLTELRDMIKLAGIEGVSFEYWSPSPYWKASRQYCGVKAETAVLRCFAKGFGNDPDYKGDVQGFLRDFAQACRQDLQTLRDSGIPISMWGLQNEPNAGVAPYSALNYVKVPQGSYATAFRVVAPVIRAFDPNIMIIADTSEHGWRLPFIRPVLNNPEEAKLVDALVVHHVGSDAAILLTIPPEESKKPLFSNEYEYMEGPTSPDRCLNTVQHIMNWFQVGRAPAWFWLHALKPIGNVEASGYSLGFWRPANDVTPGFLPGYPGLLPGAWTWNPYNWHAVGSFVKHMPWDCVAVEVAEEMRDPDLRLLAFKKPDGKLTVVLSNRSFKEHTFNVATGLKGATFKGFRYTPDEAGKQCMGVEIGILKNESFSPKLNDLTWEFWEQQ